MADEADVELLLENIGFTQGFTIVSGAQAIAITGATVTWDTPQSGVLLSTVSALSGVVEYTQRPGDWETGQFTCRLVVSFSPTARFYTVPFTVRVTRANP